MQMPKDKYTIKKIIRVSRDFHLVLVGVMIANELHSICKELKKRNQ